MQDTPDDAPLPEPANLKFLRRLVTTLTATMIVGLLVLIATVVIRLQPPSVQFPDTVSLPDGTTPMAYTQGPGWTAVVTTDSKILIFDAGTGALRQTIEIE
ncbi:MAG: DUF6476 family protein [Pseudomonadota bacterium]